MTTLQWPPSVPPHTAPVITGLRDDIPQWSSDTHPKAAAVLALFVPGPHPEDPLELLFTKRSAHVRTHKGQVGFPGGRREAQDVNPAATALRESFEEIALATESVTVLGTLPIVKSLELHPVIPVIAFSEVRIGDLRANDTEVAEIFSVPWTDFLPEEKKVMRFNIFGLWRDTAIYPARGHYIWGLTAKMITLAAFAPFRT